MSEGLGTALVLCLVCPHIPTTQIIAQLAQLDAT